MYLAISLFVLTSIHSYSFCGSSHHSYQADPDYISIGDLIPDSKNVHVKEVAANCTSHIKGLLRMEGMRLQYCDGQQWVQIAGHPAVDNEYHSVTVCEGHSKQIRCENGRKFRILSANYGRLDGSSTCPHPSIHDLNCRASSSLGKVREICQGQTACTLHSNSGFFGVGDPCRGTYKYLFVLYSCIY
ncbi:L-rhamnose-binding lectin CSL1-like [Montipora foliosa]|uniref:L-rhamnose-binding lectin CSL1-like n=1 Tax=Montipora foliosa TaxID=591990 RepID=UPI0035F19CCC